MSDKMSSQEKIAKILGVTEKTLNDFVGQISALTGRSGVIERLAEENDRIVNQTLKKINSEGVESAAHIRGALQKAIFYDEKKFLNFLESIEGADEFERAVKLSKSLAKVGPGFFLKKELIGDIFKKRPPQNLLSYLGLDSVESLAKEVDILEAFSALRFVETDEWMHQTFEGAYGGFTSADFEERPIEVRVLGPRWHDIAKKFVAKKHHNVSHLKEFGVIFLNPIKMDIPGKFLRDFALLLHYFHEIEFYSKLFRKYSASADFIEKFKSLLRGDVKELPELNQQKGWLIVQRYLIKDNPQDPRLLVPRVNPESMHWSKGERDLTRMVAVGDKAVDLGDWANLDWAAGLFKGEGGQEEAVSFDLEDNAMSLVSFMEGKNETFSYHQREALWTKIFAEYAGGEDNLERLIVENFEKGYVVI
ncbi:MAG: hypothetical protein HY454_01760 [Parcubacteria group bacterium]|nr:hypothetical protein [Parcubacteria group bacterium]